MTAIVQGRPSPIPSCARVSPCIPLSEVEPLHRHAWRSAASAFILSPYAIMTRPREIMLKFYGWGTAIA